MTHCTDDTPVCRPPPIAAMATLTIEVSSSEGIAPASRMMMSLIRPGSSRPGPAR